jgi:hypothetical protein
MRSMVALLLMTVPALAAGWTTYANGRFGATLDIPPGFVNDVPPPANGDGLTFHDAARDAELLVWGGNLSAWDFTEEAAQSVAAERNEGWTITYQKSRGLEHPERGAWFVYSGVKAGRIVYARAAASCEGTQAVHFRIEYPQSLGDDFNATIARLSQSLRAGPALDCTKP